KRKASRKQHPNSTPATLREKYEQTNPTHRRFFFVNSPANEKTIPLGAFATTCWSVILSGANSEGGERQIRVALTELCRIYWRPIFSFIVHPRYPVHDT